MKFCKNCGEVIEDNVIVCPKCGKSVTSSKLESIQNNTGFTNCSIPSNVGSNNSMQAVIMFFKILGGLAAAAGIILLAIGGIQEYLFRTEYDLSNLTKEGINFVRNYSKYPNSIKFLTDGGICSGVGIVLDMILIPYSLIAQKK